MAEDLRTTTTTAEPALRETRMVTTSKDAAARLTQRLTTAVNAGMMTPPFDFEQQARDVRELKGMGLKQATVGAIVGLSQARVSQILSQSL